MRAGSVVIANDLLGIVTSLDRDTVMLKDKKGSERQVNKSACTEIIGPYEISLLLLNKLRQEVNK